MNSLSTLASPVAAAVTLTAAASITAAADSIHPNAYDPWKDIFQRGTFKREDQINASKKKKKSRKAQDDDDFYYYDDGGGGDDDDDGAARVYDDEEGAHPGGGVIYHLDEEDEAAAGDGDDGVLILPWRFNFMIFCLISSSRDIRLAWSAVEEDDEAGDASYIGFKRGSIGSRRVLWPLDDD